MTQAERQLPEQHQNVERVTLGNLSIGIYLPEEYVTNEEIEQWGIKTQSGRLLTAFDIQKRIGINRRFIAGPNESVIDMGIKAARATGNLDHVYAIFASTSYPIGKNVSEEIGRHLQIEPKFHLDVHAACSGFVRTLAYLKEHERKFNNKKVLLVATEKYSHTLADLRDAGIDIDPSMAQLIFSDGAAACTFEFGKDIRVLGLENKTIKLSETFENCIRMPIDSSLMIEPFLAIPIPYPASGKFEQKGPSVIRGIASNVPELNKTVVKNLRLQASDIHIQLVIPHQASAQMIDSLSKNMPGYTEDTFMRDLQDGNFSSASILKALARAIKEGRVQKGDKHLWSAFGAGTDLFASSAVIEFG